MLAKNQKLIFFSAIFVVIVAVAVSIGKAAFAPAHGSMTPAQFWNAIEKGKIENQSVHVITGVVKSVEVNPAYFVAIVYFKGCEIPFLAVNESDYYYLSQNVGREVTVKVYALYAPQAGDALGRYGWVAIIFESG